MATQIHGIAASENLDSSGERILMSGLDISSLEVDGVFNWEHKSDQPAQVVGKILKAKKIFSLKDCDSEDEKRFWEKCGVPFLYVMGELMDDYKESAKEVAGGFKYDDDNKSRHERATNNFSIEGAKIEKKGMDITRSLARKVTITVHPCNKVAVAELKASNVESKIKKNDLDSLFKTETTEIELFKAEIPSGFLTLADVMAKKEDSNSHAKALGIDSMKKDDDLGGTTGAPAALVARAMPKVAQMRKGPESPDGSTIGHTSGGHEIKSHKRVHEYRGMSPKDHLEAANLHFNAAQAAPHPKMGAHHMDKVRLHMQAHKTAERREERLHPPHGEKLIKALTAGSGMVAPSALSGGAALQSESLSRKMKKNTMLARAEEEYQCWDKKEEFTGFMQRKLPMLKSGEIDAIGRTIALKKGIEASEKWLAKFGYGTSSASFTQNGTTGSSSHMGKTSAGTDSPVNDDDQEQLDKKEKDPTDQDPDQVAPISQEARNDDAARANEAAERNAVKIKSRMKEHQRVPRHVLTVRQRHGKSGGHTYAGKMGNKEPGLVSTLHYTGKGAKNVISHQKPRPYAHASGTTATKIKEVRFGTTTGRTSGARNASNEFVSKSSDILMQTEKNKADLKKWLDIAIKEQGTDLKKLFPF